MNDKLAARLLYRFLEDLLSFGYIPLHHTQHLKELLKECHDTVYPKS